jgi:hypothetical protein
VAVKFEDRSIQVKAAINNITLGWLHEWANEITSHAQRNCTTGESYSSQLRGSYSNRVDEGNGKATIGSPLEQAFWEEFGTGEHADTSKNGGKEGRKGWWVYKDGYKGKGGKILTEAEAKAIAAGDPTVHATNGREPNYTLEKAFTANRGKAIADLEEKMKAGTEK